MDRYTMWAAGVVLCGCCMASAVGAEPEGAARVRDQALLEPEIATSIGEGPDLTRPAVPAKLELVPATAVPPPASSPCKETAPAEPVEEHAVKSDAAVAPPPPPPEWPSNPEPPAKVSAQMPVPAILAAPVPVPPPEPFDGTHTPAYFAGSRTESPPAAPPATVNRPSVRDGDAEYRIQLCKARERFYAGELEEAQRLATQLKVARGAHWGRFEDSPDKLLEDIHKVCVQRDQETAARLTVEARRLMVQGKLDEAEKKAREAAAIYRPAGLFAPRSDNPEKLLSEITLAKSHTTRVTQVVIVPRPLGAPPVAEPHMAFLPAGLRPPALLPTTVTGEATASKTAVARSVIQPVADFEPIPGAPATTTNAAATTPDHLPPFPLTPAALTTAEAAPADEKKDAAPLPAPRPMPDAAAKEEPGAGAPMGGPHLGDNWENDCCFACDGGWICRGTHLTAEVGAMILWPYWKSNPAFIVAGAGAVPTTRQVDFNPDAQFVPQWSLGVQSAGGLGFRFGWWGFSINDNERANGPAASAAPLGVQSIALAPTSAMAASSRLRLNVWDFEGTEDLRVGPWWMLFSGGIRYAHLSEDYNAIVRNAAGAATSGVLSGHNFNGAGPTAALSVNRLIGCTHLYWYGNFRGSLLFGTVKQTASLAGPGAVDTEDATSSGHGILPVGEMEVGLGWERDLGTAHVFVRSGLVGQVWYEAGNASRSTVAFAPFGAPANAAALDTNLGLFGFSVRAGVDY